MIYGNTAGIKRALLWQLDEMIGNQDKNLFADREVLLFLAQLTTKYNREFSVFINQAGKILAFAVGDFSTVKLPNLSQKRSKAGFSGIRCIHTHPSGSSDLSSADLSALKANSYDAMCAVGVREGKPISSSVALMGETGIQVFKYKGLDFDDDFLLSEINHAKNTLKPQVKVEEGAEKRALLVHCSQEKDAEYSLDELASLAKTLGIEPKARIIQRRSQPDREFFVGSGKLGELAMACQVGGLGLIIFDHQLSNLQTAKIQEALGITVLDRPTLILDLFAKHAVTSEGKLQVELASLRHLLPTLTGQGVSMSRQRGGLYAMGGSGETKLEIDRRVIRARINALSEKLDKIKDRNDQRRDNRKKRGVKTVAIVGYTNAGKSTLMNKITKAGVLEEDKLFATLESVSRNVWQEEGEYLLTDTVGFISRLPHEFVDAFKSTLDEARYADLLLVVVDASDAMMHSRYQVVEKVLTEIGAGHVEKIIVYNKCDKGVADNFLPTNQNSVKISAKTGEGLDLLRKMIVEKLFGR